MSRDFGPIGIGCRSACNVGCLWQPEFFISIFNCVVGQVRFGRSHSSVPLLGDLVKWIRFGIVLM